MRKKLLNIFESLFSVCIAISLSGSVLVFILIVVSAITNSEALTMFATKTLMPWVIRCAALALLGGLGALYASGEHELTMD